MFERFITSVMLRQFKTTVAADLTTATRPSRHPPLEPLTPCRGLNECTDTLKFVPPQNLMNARCTGRMNDETADTKRPTLRLMSRTGTTTSSCMMTFEFLGMKLLVSVPNIAVRTLLESLTVNRWTHDSMLERTFARPPQALYNFRLKPSSGPPFGEPKNSTSIVFMLSAVQNVGDEAAQNGTIYLGPSSGRLLVTSLLRTISS